jgi:hypothetical protein
MDATPVVQNPLKVKVTHRPREAERVTSGRNVLKERWDRASRLFKCGSCYHL